jgi:hypothetical protein
MEMLRSTSRTTLTVATVALNTVALACGYWLVAGGEDEIVGWLIVSVVGAVIAAILLLHFVPGTEDDPAADNKPAKRGLVLGALAFVTIAVFWTGLPIVLGVPALVLAAEGRARAATQGHGAEATAAAVLGAVGLLVATVLLVSGT